MKNDAAVIGSGNLFAEIPERVIEEQASELVSTPRLRIERIVSNGHSSPAGFWYDQDCAEWLVVLSGSAGLLLEGEAVPRVLRMGDYLHIPAHLRHRVEWTAENEVTVWLAVHHG
jgi:cupin 2 domain-containing protein